MSSIPVSSEQTESLPVDVKPRDKELTSTPETDPNITINVYDTDPNIEINTYDTDPNIEINVYDADPNDPITAYEKVKQLLSEYGQRWNAVSLNLYVRDPLTNHMRPAFDPSPLLQYPEALHASEFPAHLEILSGMSWNSYLAEVDLTPELRDEQDKHVQRLLEKPDKLMFGDFFAREGIQSTAHLRHPKTGTPDVVLFVNFKERNDFASKLRIDIEDVFSTCVALSEGIVEELVGRSSQQIGALMRILDPIQQLAALDASPNSLPNTMDDDPLHVFFRDVLDAALDALDFEEDEGSGTIHLFDPTTGELKLNACRGISVDESCHVQNAFVGQGIISWVALKRQALIIDDIETSNFRFIYQKVSDGMRSEVSVPMMAHGVCIGVLDLESKVPHRFSPEAVRILSLGANQAAIAYVIRQQVAAVSRAAERLQKLLSISCVPIDPTATDIIPMDALAGLVMETMEANQCEVWTFDSETSSFVVAGTNLGIRGTDRRTPRKEGWSKIIVGNKKPVLLTEIQTIEIYDAYEWNIRTESWEKVPPPVAGDGGDRAASLNLNDHVVHAGFKSEVGIPITIDGGDKNPCGVIWVKYKEPQWAKLNDIFFMRTAIGFAGHCGKVIAQRLGIQLLVKNRSADAVRLGVHDKYFKSRSFELPNCHGYAISKPKDQGIGGDFYVVEKVADTVSMILIGDAEGHGVNAALLSLPLYATFKNTRQISGTGSPQYVLEQLHRIAHESEMDLSATALCFCVLEAEDRFYLTGSSAGHPQLTILGQDGETHIFPEPDKRNPDNPVNSGTLGRLSDRPVIVVETREVFEGDMIVAYTDGVEEAWPKRQGQRQIQLAVLPRLDDDPKEIAEHLLKSAEAAAGGHLADDATVIVVRVGKKPD